MRIEGPHADSCVQRAGHEVLPVVKGRAFQETAPFMGKEEPFVAGR